MRVWLAGLVLFVAGTACSPPPEPPPTPRPTSLPTRFERIAPTPPLVVPAPTSTAPPTEPPRVFARRDVDPYADWYATERTGLYVTTRDPRGRYYYEWDDPRWRALENRVWFRSVEDLLTVFPGRVAAP